MPEIPPPPTERWVCCCDTEPPSLRCTPCTARGDHAACATPTRLGAPRANRLRSVAVEGDASGTGRVVRVVARTDRHPDGILAWSAAPHIDGPIGAADIAALLAELGIPVDDGRRRRRWRGRGRG